MLMHPTQITHEYSKHILKKGHPPKGKKQDKKNQKTEESLKRLPLYFSYALKCGYLFAYFLISISPPIFRISLHSEVKYSSFLYIIIISSLSFMQSHEVTS